MVPTATTVVDTPAPQTTPPSTATTEPTATTVADTPAPQPTPPATPTTDPGRSPTSTQSQVPEEAPATGGIDNSGFLQIGLGMFAIISIGLFLLLREKAK